MSTNKPKRFLSIVLNSDSPNPKINLSKVILYEDVHRSKGLRGIFDTDEKIKTKGKIIHRNCHWGKKEKGRSGWGLVLLKKHN